MQQILLNFIFMHNFVKNNYFELMRNFVQNWIRIDTQMMRNFVQKRETVAQENLLVSWTSVLDSAPPPPPGKMPVFIL